MSSTSCIDLGTSQFPKSTRSLTTYLCPSRPGHQALRNNFANCSSVPYFSRNFGKLRPF
ncbi:hypothetical protein [Thiolapillus sp.]|uniref:hypothetical protein n=1 Tax=Thiolapillus sp. TaxID=2017437 RepID=UPI0025F93EEC|nr:hypothetical protein [Thiolapillus sp.]